MAVGAGRARLVRQLLVESVLLSAFGGVAGLVVARLMVRLLSAYALPGAIDIGALELGLDPRALTFTASLTVLTSVLFGLVPALQATRLDVLSAVRQKVGERRGGGRLTRSTLLAAQTALTLVLLVGAGLFVRSLQRGLQAELGAGARNLAFATLHLGRTAMTRHERSSSSTS